MYTRSSVRGVPNLTKVGAWGIRIFPNFLCFSSFEVLFVSTPLRHFLGGSSMQYTSLCNFWQRSFIHEVGATVEYSLDVIPVMDETSHILNLLAQGYCLDSWIGERIVSTHRGRMMMKTA